MASYARLRSNDCEDDDDLEAFRDRDLAPLFTALGDVLGGEAIDATFPRCDAFHGREDFERVEAALYAAACLSDQVALKVVLKDTKGKRVDVRVAAEAQFDPLAESLERYAEILVFRADEVVGAHADSMRTILLHKPPTLPGMKRRAKAPPECRDSRRPFST